MKKLLALLALCLPFMVTSCLQDEVYDGATINSVKNTVAYNETQSVTVTADITALVPIRSVKLFYAVNGGSEQTVEMTADGGSYIGIIPAQPLDTEVSYYVKAATATKETVSAVATYKVGATPIDYSGLVLNELNGNDKFIELYNKGNADIPLDGVYMLKDAAATLAEANWVADSRSMAPGEYLLLKSEDVVTAETYEEALIFHSGLSAKKAVRIRLMDPNGQIIDDFNLADCKKTAPASYSRGADDKWYHADATPGAANAESTELVEGVKEPEKGTPAEPDPAPDPDPDPTPDPEPTISEYNIFINEISCGEKKIEIYNAESSEIDIKGYKFVKDGSDADAWTVPDGMGAIAAGGFVVFTAKQETAATGPTFGLSGTKGFKLEVYAGETLIDVIDNKTTVTTVEDTETYGRRTDGGSELVLFSKGTIGSSNAAGVVKGEEGTAKIVLNEINGNTKYIEIANIGDGNGSLEGWTLTKDEKVVWTGTADHSIAAGAYLVLYSSKSSVSHDAANEFSGGISAKANVEVCIKDADGNVIDTFTRGEKGTEWGDTELPANSEASFCRVPDGTGAWAYAAPTPGEANGEKTGDIEQEPAPDGVLVLNELNGVDKFIELYNTGTVGSISLKDVTIYKDGGTDPIWTGADGLKIAPGKFVVLYSEDVAIDAESSTVKEGYDANLIFNSGLSPKKGLKIELKDADAATLDTFTRGATIGGKISEVTSSYGRVPDGTGEWKLIAATPGATNGESLGDIPQE